MISKYKCYAKTTGVALIVLLCLIQQMHHDKFALLCFTSAVQLMVLVAIYLWVIDANFAGCCF